MSETVNSGKLQCCNSMDTQIRERGEGRLKAMLSVPVKSKHTNSLVTGNIVAINIDSVVQDVFPTAGKVEFEVMQKRALDVAAIVNRMNEMRIRLLSMEYRSQMNGWAAPSASP